MADPVAVAPTPTVEQEVAALPNARTYSVDQQLIPWEEDPTAAARGESLALLTTLEELRYEARVFNGTVGPIRDQIEARRAVINQIRQVIAAHKPTGLSGYIDVDIGLSGFSSSFKKLTRSIKDVTQDVSKSLSNALKSIDKATFRKVGDELEEAGVRDFLRKIEKYTIRPGGQEVAKAAKEVRKGMQILDKYVPGWTVLVNFIVPIPGLSLLLSAASGSLVSGEILTLLAPGFVATPLGSFVNETVKFAAQIAAPVTTPIAQLLASGTTLNQFVSQFPFTIAKGTDVYIRTDGPFQKKLLAVTEEALNELALAVSIASFGATAAATAASTAAAAAVGSASAAATSAAAASTAASVAILSNSLQVIKAGITFIKAYEAAKEVKKAAKKYQQDGLAVIQALEAEEAAARAELEALRQQIEQINAERAKLAAIQAQLAAIKAKQAADAAAAQGTTVVAGVDQGAINRGRLFLAGALGFFFLSAAVLLTEDEEEDY